MCHRGEEKLFDHSRGSAEGFFYTAFFCDVEHELRPIERGRRLCLVYHLLRNDPGPIPMPPGDHAEALLAVEASVTRWRKATKPAVLLAMKLEHRYTPKKLSFAGLKGRDAAVV